jgi:hypothetical protein
MSRYKDDCSSTTESKCTYFYEGCDDNDDGDGGMHLIF